MVQVRGTVHDVSDNPDRVERIVVRAAEPRMYGTTYITEESVQFLVVDGVLDFEVLPGPCVVAFLRHHGATTYEKLMVPDAAEATFKECLEAGNLAEEGDRSALEKVVRQIQDELAKAAPLVEEVRTLSTEVRNDRTAVDGFTKAAKKSASEAATSESNAKGHETAAGDYAAVATTAATEAAAARDAAKQSQSAAKTSETNANKHRQAAATSESNAATHKTNAGESAAAAASSAAEAKGHADRAEVASDPEGLRNEMTKQFAALVDGAPEDLDTIREIAEYAQANRDITDQLNAAIGNKANKTHTHAQSQITGLSAALSGKADTDYVDEQDRKIFQQDVIFEGELDQTSRIFPLRTSVNGKINIQVEWSVTQEYVDAASSSSLSLLTVKLHDKDGSVVSGSTYNDQIDGMSYTGSGAPGHNYYKYSSPNRIGEVVTNSNTITVAPGFFVSEVGVYNWSRPSVPGLVVRKVTISAESQTTEVMGQKVNRVEVYDNERAISDNTSGGQILRLNPDGHIWIKTSSVTDAHHAANKGYVDEEVSKKANTSHTHTQAQITGLSTALSGKADSSHKHSSADITDAVDHIHGGRAGKLVQVGEHGHIRDGNRPTDQYDLANKMYVDEEVAKKANKSHTHSQSDITGLSTALSGKAAKSHTHTTSQISGLGTALNAKADKSYVDARPALFSGVGAPPSSIPGAVAGDFWLDTDAMELHKITGV